MLQSYSGLRGAVAFSLALTRIFEEREESFNEHPDEFILRKTMLTAVTFLVLFTVFVQVSCSLNGGRHCTLHACLFQGITIKPLVRLIKVKTAVESKPSLNEVIHGTVSCCVHVCTHKQDTVWYIYNLMVGFQISPTPFHSIDTFKLSQGDYLL